MHATAVDSCLVCVRIHSHFLQGPVVEVEVETDSYGLRDFVVHSNSEMLGCVLRSEVKMYDIRGVSMSAIRHSEIDRLKPLPNISAVAMHKLRCMTVVGSSDGTINVYGQPKTSL
ncbi:hypothetical protein OESDEN_25160 [Oesophagostomum dentatum]|uniref:WD domain, G-beta repeat protein n=1 Tax=Oesophagostomum dentatum TaxID=61180 RepID=A0A0B1RRF4_OESDE|nr:hypothetical protein OESDEN_25160 [Oesophagostomum dentatum]